MKPATARIATQMKVKALFLRENPMILFMNLFIFDILNRRSDAAIIHINIGPTGELTEIVGTLRFIVK